MQSTRAFPLFALWIYCFFCTVFSFIPFLSSFLQFFLFLCPSIFFQELPWKLIIYTNIYYFFILLSFLLWINNKQWHCGVESWAHLITKHHDTEDKLPVEITYTCIFVACATIHRWRSQLLKNKPTQTCLCWKSLSTWKPQTIATRYINSTQSPSATEDTGRNLFSHIFTATGVFT